MASEIRVNTFKNRSGLGTVSINDTGASFSGVVTATSFSGDLTGNVTSSSTSTFTNGLNVTGGDVGIGTDNPNAAKLDVRGSNNPLLKLTQTTSGIARLNIESETNDGYQYAGIGIGTASADAELMWTTLGFDVNVADSVRLRIPSSGDVQVLTGNLVIGTSGKGIDFSATSDAGGMDSELLDDYEEGTWTPTYTFGTTDHTSMVSGGTYVKVGKMVFVTGYLYTNNSSTYSGTATITGLPFAIPSGLDNRGAFTIGQCRRFNEDMPNIKLYPGDNSSYISIFRQSTNSNGVTELTNAQFNFQSEYNILSFSGSYATS